VICNQIPHRDLPSLPALVVVFRIVWPVMILPFHVRILLPNEPNQFRRVYGGHGIVCVKFDSRHLGKVVDALRILPA